MMQQDVAGSLRVSLNSSLSILSPKIEDPPQAERGTKGVDGSPRNWIPASAGMTESGAAECCRGFGGVPQPDLPPGAGSRELTQANVMMQQNAAGVWGVPSFLTLPPRVGDQGG
jgi:hypothetical protein